MFPPLDLIGCQTAQRRGSSAGRGVSWCGRDSCTMQTSAMRCFTPFVGLTAQKSLSPRQQPAVALPRSGARPIMLRMQVRCSRRCPSATHPQRSCNCRCQAAGSGGAGDDPAGAAGAEAQAHQGQGGWRRAVCGGGQRAARARGPGLARRRKLASSGQLAQAVLREVAAAGGSRGARGSSKPPSGSAAEAPARAAGLLGSWLLEQLG